MIVSEYVRLVAITSTPPKVDVAASKLVPRKKKDRVLGVQNCFENNLAFLNVRLVITFSISFCLFFFYIFFICFLLFLYIYILWLRGGMLGQIGEYNQMSDILG